MHDGKNKRFYWTIIVLLVIIIIILLYFIRIGRVVDNDLKPTGNVDVFDISIFCGCSDSNKCPKKDDNPSNIPDVVPDDIPVFDDEDDIDVTGVVFVDDKNGNYIYQQDLKIFTNSAFEVEDKIAPGVSNTYNFVVHNSSNVNILYDLFMYDISEYKINMMYRLRRNNQYVIGSSTNWVSVDDLNLTKLYINAGSSDNYSLDWKWEYDGGKDQQDTIAGKNMTSKYKLNIRFNFNQA